ncbi:MAG: SDR family oxidoreductase [Acidobacteriia bacterium]|nr:SDR family oxidoreductase [Terriglobia bacterium]
MKVLVIGGTQFIGPLLVDELVKGGHDVAVLHRKPKHDLGRRVENIMADRNDADSLREALSGRRFEVVFDNAYDWQRGTTAAQVEATVRAAGNRINRYVFMSSVAAYGDGLNHKESDPLAPDYHAEPYVRHKATTERLLFRMRARSGFPVVTFRPPFLYGANNPYYREQFFWDRLRAGRPIIIPGDGYRLMQFAYVNDLVQAMVRAMVEPKAVGEAFNIGDPKPVTQAELVERLARVANVEPTLVRVPRDIIAQSGGNAMEEPYYFGEYFDMPPITENMGKVTRVLKMKLTPFEIALKDTYRWYTRNHKPRTAGFEFDDKVLAMAKAGSTANV